MKLSALFVGTLVCASSGCAQYFSEGWTPGEPVSSSTPPAPEFIPGPAHASTPVGGGSILENLLASEPFASLLLKFGVNITEKLGDQPKLWDERIPLITDDNYGEIIINEILAEEEEKERVWFLVITVAAAKDDGISKYVDQAFDSAYNETIIAGDLPYVRWGRIDYMNVTAITTKWGIWQAPYVVILTDRGQTLRFYKASQLRLKVDLIREFLQTKAWESTPPWSSSFSPGGSREYIMEYLAIVLSVWYNNLVLVPKWILWLVTGGLASLAMNLLHKTPQAKPAETQPKSKAVASPPSSSSNSGSIGAKKGARLRKGKK